MRARAIELVLTAALAALAATPASAETPTLAGALDLSNASGLAIDGALPGDGAGSQIEPVGDVNGDGRTDFAVVAPHPLSSLLQPDKDGSVSIVFGGLTQGELDLANLGNAGFRIILPLAFADP